MAESLGRDIIFLFRVLVQCVFLFCGKSVIIVASIQLKKYLCKYNNILEYIKNGRDKLIIDIKALRLRRRLDDCHPGASSPVSESLGQGQYFLIYSTARVSLHNRYVVLLGTGFLYT